jgi:LysM repeat protein
MPPARIATSFRVAIGVSVVLSLFAVDVGTAFGADAPSSGQPSSAPVRYQVKKGDSLSAIARRNGVSVAALAAANGISNVHLIVVGQSLVIPTAGVLVPSATPPPPAAPTPVSSASYVLRRGDSLNAVARMFKVTLGAIVAANNIRNPNRVPVGLRVVIPGAPAPTTTVAPAPTVPSTPPMSDSALIAAVSADSTTTTLMPVPVTPVATVSGVAPSLTADQLARLPAALLGFPERLALIPSFDRWAAEYGLPPALLKALAFMESGWQANVVSPSGAIGIGQLLPATAAFVASVLIGAPLDPNVPDDNIRMSARFLAHLLGLTGGDVSLALAGYYQGLTSVSRDGMKATTAAYVTVVIALEARF